MQVISGDTTAPHDPLFKKLQDTWNLVSEKIAELFKLDALKKFDWNRFRGTELGERAEEVLQFCMHASLHSQHL